MLLRAIFWIAVVALFMPHGQAARSDASRCEHLACSAGLDLLAHIRSAGLHSLARVRAEIQDAERARKSS